MFSFEEQDKLKEIKRTAANGNLFLAKIGDEFVVYRIVPNGMNQRIGKRKSLDSLLKFVRKCASNN